MRSGSKNGAFAEAIVETIAQPLLVLDGRLRVQAANPAFLRHFQVSAGATEGRLVYDLGNRQWDIPELRRLLEEILPRDTRIEDYRIQHEFEAIGERIMMLNARRMWRSEEPDLILVAISDITERERLAFELEGKTEFAEKLIDSVRESLLVLGWDLRVKYANQSFYEGFRVTPEETEGQLVYELGNGQWNIAELRELLEAILPEANCFDDYEITHDFEDIGRRTMMLNARRLDHTNLILLAIRDVTESRAHDTQQKLMTAELQHRVKNILNNVHAVAQQTRRGADSLDDFFDAFQARLNALVRTQDLLVRNPTQSVQLHDVLDLEMTAIGAEHGIDYIVEGPSVTLSARKAQAFAMTVHELTTNAAKYGALAVDGGTIEVTWNKERRKRHEHLVFSWREFGVAISDLNPAKGFGSRVIERSLPHMLEGTGELSFHPDGAECRLDFPLSPATG